MKRIVYPFTGIVGQEEMKKGLILNAVNQNIGGLLVFGEKGTAKSTALRGFGNLLPEIEVVKGCRFGCDINDRDNLCVECKKRMEAGEVLEKETRKMKVVELPIGATEDRVVGSLNIEEALKSGKKKFDIGILGEANRGILYIDEINLLDDNIVDLLLDSAAMGFNTVEREGISFSHPAKFILVATMNPEEGELRPQLLDRFGLSVKVKGIRNPEERIKVIKNRGEFEKNPQKFLEEFKEQEEELKNEILKAKEILKEVEISDELLILIAKIGIKFDIDGHRGDLTLMKTAMTIASLEERKVVKREDVLKAAPMVLFHRMRKLPFEEIRDITEEDIIKAIEEVEVGD